MELEIKKPEKFIKSFLQHRLDPRLSVEAIQAALPGIEDEGDSGDGKSAHLWQFVANNRECAIWDYGGLRWSAYGPEEVFEALALPVIGGVQDVGLALTLLGRPNNGLHPHDPR